LNIWLTHSAGSRMEHKSLIIAKLRLLGITGGGSATAHALVGLHRLALVARVESAARSIRPAFPSVGLARDAESRGPAEPACSFCTHTWRRAGALVVGGHRGRRSGQVLDGNRARGRGCWSWVRRSSRPKSTS